MQWDVLGASREKIDLARALVPASTSAGWNRLVLDAVSQAVFNDPHRWRGVFPKGPAEAIWFISDVSDASMAAAFAERPAPDLATVIETRLDQNSDLKPFVRKVMLFDFAHPRQALTRMQRTARVMVACLGPGGHASFIHLAALNLIYTVIVFVWLFDASRENARTRAFTRWATALL